MNETKKSIACVILTKNEEINISRCLTSVAWCSERVVVDSGSTDRTCSLAEKLGVKVVVHQPEGAFNIAEQRNWALAGAGIGSDWVLFLDADEEVTLGLRAVIEQELSANQSLNAYELTPRYIFWGKWLKYTQGYPNWHSRLLKRKEVSFAGGVWEHFDCRARIGRIKEPYIHYGNSKGLSDWLVRHDRYSTWDAEKIGKFLATKDPETLATKRKAWLRLWAARFYPLRPFARFAHMYFFRLGFLEGLPALVFCSQYFFYESMTVIKIWERKRLQSGRPL